MRFSIEISPEQHQRLKHAAASRGKTIRDHILEKALADDDKRTALQVRKKSVQQQKNAWSLAPPPFQGGGWEGVKVRQKCES